MLIRKTYNIGQLKDELGEKIERAREGCTGAAVVDVIIAQEILEVLEETLRREQKHQTLESALTFIEKEDGTQSNSMELSEVTKYCDCFGSYKGVGNQKCFLCCLSDTCKDKTVNKVNKQTATKVPKCFGKYTIDGSWERNCEYCGREVDCYLKSCKKECFGKYDKLSSECEDCEFVNECVIAKEAKQNE